MTLLYRCFPWHFAKSVRAAELQSHPIVRMFLVNFRSSRPEVFCKRGVLKNFSKFTGKHLCQSLFLDKVAGLRQVFSCEFCQISKNTFFYRTPLVASSETWRTGEKGTLLQVLSWENLQIFLDSYSVELLQTWHGKMLSKKKDIWTVFSIFFLYLSANTRFFNFKIMTYIIKF